MDYRHRISGPLLDRIDIWVQTKPVEPEKVRALGARELPSSHYRARVEAARDRQRFRFRREPGIHCNALIPPGLLARHCALSSEAGRFLDLAVKGFHLSARSHDRILKMARSRADLEGHESIGAEDMQFAIDSRNQDRDAFVANELRYARRGPPHHATGL